MSAPPTGAPAASDPLLSEEADALLTALADRTRRRILVRLAERPDDAGAVARDLALSRQAVAKHLAVLADAGIVQAERRSRRHVHRVTPRRLREVSDLLGLAAQGWDRRLERIRQAAKTAERRPAQP